jgi:xylulokinase
MAFNLGQLAWAADLLDDVGIDPTLFAPARPSGVGIGRVTAQAAAETGLPVGAVVGTGGHDHVCGALAAGVVHHGQMLDSMGTAEALFFPRDVPLQDLSVGKQGYSQGAHVVPERYYLFGGLYTSGASTEWWREIARHGSYEELVAEAAAAPAGANGVTFLPHLRLGHPPTPDARARGAFVGLSTDTTRGDMTRAVFEGLAFDARSSIEPVLLFSGLGSMPEITVIGGSSRNDVLLGIKSSVLGTPLRVLALEEATALGAAMLGGIAAGTYQNASDALSTIDQAQRTIHPQPSETANYERHFHEVYRRLFPAVQPINHAIHELAVDFPNQANPT